MGRAGRELILEQKVREVIRQWIAGNKSVPNLKIEDYENLIDRIVELMKHPND